MYFYKEPTEHCQNQLIEFEGYHFKPSISVQNSGVNTGRYVTYITYITYIRYVTDTWTSLTKEQIDIPKPHKKLLKRKLLLYKVLLSAL